MECKEVMIAGAANSGKTSLINSLNDNTIIGRVSKQSGKTQAMMFYLCQKTQNRKKNDPLDVYRGFIVDSPGYGFTYLSAKMKNDLKKLVNGYLSHAVRLQLVFVLVDASTGLKGSDLALLERLESFNKPV